MALSSALGVAGFPFREDLAALLADVFDAREAVAQRRHAPGGPGEPVAASRLRLLRALEAYAEALEVRHLPMPYGLRDELRIYRNVRF
jgi:hypothetical protein